MSGEWKDSYENLHTMKCHLGLNRISSSVGMKPMARDPNFGVPHVCLVKIMLRKEALQGNSGFM